jgi:hypothetical protein
MLTPLGIFIVVTLIACTVALLIIGAWDAAKANSEAVTLPATIREFHVHPRARRLRAVGAALARPSEGRRRWIGHPRAALRSLGSKTKLRVLSASR